MNPPLIEQTVASERRRAERLPVQLRGRYQADHHSADIEITSLSRLGLFVRGGQHLGNAGCSVHLEVQLPDGRVALEGEIVRHLDDAVEPGAAIRFTTAPPSVRRDLANYLIKRHYQAQS